MQNKRVLILVFLGIAAICCYVTIAQVILIREFLNVFYGNGLCLWGLSLAHAFNHAMAF